MAEIKEINSQIWQHYGIKRLVTLRKYNFHERVARKKPFITEANQKVRQQLAKTYVKKPPKFWKRVIFVGENKYNFLRMMGSKDYSGNSMLNNKKNLAFFVKYSEGSLMVWGLLNRNLHLIYAITDKCVHLSIMKQNLLKKWTYYQFSKFTKIMTHSIMHIFANCELCIIVHKLSKRLHRVPI